MSVIEKRDPVCGMDVVPEQAAGTSEFNGRRIIFVHSSTSRNRT